MSTYAFKAIDPRGASAQGEIEAADETSVLNQLRARGLIVLRVNELKPQDVGDLFGRFKRVKARDLTVVTRQLATMVDAGIPLLRSLYVIEEQTDNEQLKGALTSVRKDVEAGSSLSEALASHPKIFNQLFVAMVKAGEAGGILDDTLLRVADQLEKQDSLRRQIRSAMVYPALIGSFALVVLLALVAFLIPIFEKTLKSIDPKNTDFPAITQVSISASHLVTDRWYVLIGVVALIVFGFRQWKRSKSGKANWERFKLRIPFRIGKLVHKIALARFSRTFAGLVSGGVPVLETIEITGRTAGNVVIEQAMAKVHESVRSGGTIAGPMRAAPYAFPVMVPQMIEVGEDSGTLEQMLDKIADFYEDEVAASVKALSSLLEPIMLIVVGGVVGFIVISMYLPLFDIYNKIK